MPLLETPENEEIPVEDPMPCAKQLRILTRQDTDAESCSVRRRRGETPSIERRATLSDNKRKEKSSVRVSKVHSSQWMRSFARGSRCRSRISFVESLQFGSRARTDQQSHENSGSKDCRGLRVGKLQILSAWSTSKVKGKQDVTNDARANNTSLHWWTFAT